MIITYQDAVEIIMLFVMTIVLVYLFFNVVLDKHEWYLEVLYGKSKYGV